MFLKVFKENVNFLQITGVNSFQILRKISYSLNQSVILESQSI